MNTIDMQTKQFVELIFILKCYLNYLVFTIRTFAFFFFFWKGIHLNIEEKICRQNKNREWIVVQIYLHEYQKIYLDKKNNIIQHSISKLNFGNFLNFKYSFNDFLKKIINLN